MATDTIAVRPAPPPLEPTNPDCSLCGTATELIDDYFTCETRQAWWPTRTCHRKPGEWHEPQAEQCRSLCQPWPHDPTAAMAAVIWRCVLHTDHDGDHHDTDGHDWTPARQTGQAGIDGADDEESKS